MQLWSEMVTTKAILNGDKNRLLDFDAAEHPLVLQLGGSESDEMAQCAKIGWSSNTGDRHPNISIRVTNNSFYHFQCSLFANGTIGI
jgi:tRNA-dihydrouridine synthase A